MPSEPLRVRDLFLFQIGNADAVQRVVASRWSLVIGLLLVFTAAIARNYDQVFLPWHGERFAGPFIVPIISSFLVFTTIWWSGTRNPDDENQPGFFRQYPGFLGTFLMTAPLAWIYAIPVEALTDNLLSAAKWNVFFLAVVSLWRVWLIARVAQVITEAPFFVLLIAVLVPSSAEAFIASGIAEVNIAGIMGGILPPDRQFMVNALMITSQGAAICFVASLLIYVGLAIACRSSIWKAGFLAAWTPRPNRAILAAGAAAILWVGIAVPGQLKILNRINLAHLVSEKKYDEAVAFLRSKVRHDFPSGRAFDYHSTENLTLMLNRLGPNDPLWITSEFSNAASLGILERLRIYGFTYDADLRDLILAFSKLPGGRETLRSTADLLLDPRHPRGVGMSVDDKAAFIADLEKAGINIPDEWRPAPVIPPPPPAEAGGDRETIPAN